MVFTKEKIKNAIIVVIAGALLFTPVGFQFKVLVNRIVSFSPSVLKDPEQTKLSSYNWLLSSNDSTTDTVNFSKYKHKVVVVNFWATWCPPCVAEMPSFQSLYNDYKDKVSFVFIANDEKQIVDAYFLKKDLTLPIFYEKSKTPSELSSTSIPITYIINKSGTIIVKEKGAADWDSEKIRTLLDALIAEN